MIIDAAFIILGYLLGSLSTAIIACRLMGLPDPRSQGSHNPGATNVLRFGGKKAAAITLAGDCLKGVLPVVLAATAGAASEAGIAGTALAAFLGHLYPLFFGFEGGKGVATAFGAVLGLSPWAGLAALATWLLAAAVARISSLAALTATVLIPFYMWWLDLPASYIVATLIMAGLLVWRHRSNISRLLAGTEERIGVKESNDTKAP